MTRIDRYILVLFLRTALICFISLSGIVIVFHAFTSMDDLVKRGHEQGGLVPAMIDFYGPYLLLLIDSTGVVILLMALLFTVGWLRRTGELTSSLAAGVSHGRLFRPMLWASVVIILLQTANRECLLPHYSHRLSMKGKPAKDEIAQPVLAQYDKLRRILIDGEMIDPTTHTVTSPGLRIDGDYPGFGDRIVADSMVYLKAQGSRPAGYLLSGVRAPQNVSRIPSATFAGDPILITAADAPDLAPDQIFFATSIDSDLLLSRKSATKLAAAGDLFSRLRNPAVHSPSSLEVIVHARLVRPLLDIALVALILPLAAGGGNTKLFVVMGVALCTVLFFFVLKAAAAWAGGASWVAPLTAAWIPIFLLGPIAYSRYRWVQTV
ncbi:MAG: LptF/LptG family permease [Planctomycetota bacterium]